MGQTVKEAYLGLKAELSGAVSDADREAKLILAHVTNYTGSPLFLELSLSASQEKALKSIIKRRLDMEPLQYILGEWEFMGLPI
ncbi:MAG TPA: peptide chain release factor N(5)-glutamine methyltransferase, partial [Clostridia bacterium]|nr:peptide chain release factor N(5)-glutamine methyltransferase [Clostridia bacterium]